MKNGIASAEVECGINLAEQVKTPSIGGYIRGKTVLVTGGAGSIGRELCRRILSLSCKRLIIFDADENGLYETGIDFSGSGFSGRFVLCLGSVRDMDRMTEVMKNYRPELVFHAAAYKQVPMLEDNPFEAMKNNVFGTRNAALAAVQAQAELFLLISSDKAVHPVGILGASKRIAELLVQGITAEHTRLSAVRFGNVLGSRGSVIPRFEQQIRSGGPVTLTDPNMQRYFITIGDAVELTLEAAATAISGEILVLDMGEPMRIQELAVQMIEKAGKTLKEIPIITTGIRPGERLREELFFDKEEAIKKADRIFRCTAAFPVKDQLEQALVELELAVRSCDETKLHHAIRRVIPEYPERGEQSD